MYTVKKIAKLSGISVRTLHYYDEIGLLKPSYYGANNYRYYNDQQLLLLQQILFFRELKFQLSDIKRIISDPEFDQIKALEAHRKILINNLKQAQQLITTVDKTLAYLRGKEQMKLEEIFEGFNAEKQEIYENFLIDHGVAEEVIKKAKHKIQHWTGKEGLQNKRDMDHLHEELVSAINNNLEPSSDAVQKIIKKHYEMTKIFWTPTRETYIGLSELYGSHPDFVNFYHRIHPKLLGFLSAGMKIFAERNLD